MLFSLGAIIFLFRGIEIEVLAVEMSKFNYWSIIPFAILETLSLWARGMRWRVLLEEKVSALENVDTSHSHKLQDHDHPVAHSHTKTLVNEKEIELLQVQIEEIKVKSSNPLAN